MDVGQDLVAVELDDVRTVRMLIVMFTRNTAIATRYRFRAVTAQVGAPCWVDISLLDSRHPLGALEYAPGSITRSSYRDPAGGDLSRAAGR